MCLSGHKPETHRSEPFAKGAAKCVKFAKVKRRNNDFLAKVVRAEIFGARSAGAVSFQLDVDAYGSPQAVRDFSKLRHALSLTGVEPSQFSPRDVLEFSFAIGRSLKGIVMKHREMSTHQVDVKFNRIHPKAVGKLEPRERVLRCKSCRTTVTNDHKVCREAHTIEPMTYEVLARRLRPRSFDELIGQEHVVRVLRHALDHGRLHHAYLFTGTRGVGKTTIARILAKCMNCEKGVTATPCSECSSCQEISEGRFPDLVEVDAASRTRVEQTRELLENVPYAPTRGRFKVYLIDEVHMLSQSSFNALLKTLEEPPDHVRFLLATTDAKKVPVTVLSRCLQLQLKNLLPERITPYLERILEADGVGFDKASIVALARAGHGSMRDALSLTDQAISYCGGALAEQDVFGMLGAVRHESLDVLISALIRQDAAATMSAIEGLSELGVDFADVLDQLTLIIHQAAVQQALGDVRGSSSMARLAAWDPASLQLAYQIAIIAARDLPLAPDPRCGFEMAMLRLLAFRPGDRLPADQSGQGPAKSEQPPLDEEPAAAGKAANTSTQAMPRDSPADEVSSNSTPPDQAPLDWHTLTNALQADPLVVQLARHAWCIGWDGRNLRLGVDKQYEPSVEPESIQALAEALGRILDAPIELDISYAPPCEETPVERDQRIEQGRASKARALIESDPFVRFLVSEFKATIESESIELVGVNNP